MHHPYHSLVALCLVSVSAGAVFQRRGSADTTAPYTNVTATASPSVSVSTIASSRYAEVDHPSISFNVTLSSVHQEVPSQPAGWDASQTSAFIVALNASSTESAHDTPMSTLNQSNANTSIPSSTNTTSAQHASNATCTINIPSASINYWYAPTYSHLLGTMTTAGPNFTNADSYTLIPHMATFDIASALVSDYVCTTSYSYVADWDWTMTLCVDYTGSPTAAATSIAYRSAAAPWPTGGLIPVSDALSYDLYTDGRPSATTEVGLAPNLTTTETSATPFVYFTAYEVETGNKTETVRLHSAQAYPYWLKGVDEGPTATGPLPEDFLGFLEQSSQYDCDAGQLQATITVLIVVDLYYENMPNADPFIIHFESTALGFEDPPVNINNEGTQRGQPVTIPDWDLPGVGVKTTPVTNKPSVQPSQTLTPSNDDNMINLGGKASQIEDIPPQPTRVIIGTIGTNPVVIGPSSQIIVGTQTLQPGAPAITIDGSTPVSLAPSATAIVIEGATSPLPQVFSFIQPTVRVPPIITIGTSTLTPNAATQFFVGPGQTLTPGGIATIGGTIVSLAPAASFVVIGGSTQVLPVAEPAVTRAPQVVVGGLTITAQPAVSSNGQNQPNGAAMPALGPTFIISDQTLLPGGPAITISGTTLSLAPSGSFVLVNGITSAVAIPTASPIAAPLITIGGDVFGPTFGPGTTFLIDGQTLVPGASAITVSGTTISLASFATIVVINGVTTTLVATAARITTPPLTLGNTIFTALPGSEIAYVISSMLLTPGGSIVVAGTTVSLAPGASALVVNGQTSIITASLPIVTNPPLLTVGSYTYTAVSGSGTTFVLGDQTLTPGGTIIVNGTMIVLAPGATQLIYGSSGRTITTALFPATTTRSQTVTSASNASAGPNSSVRQATTTSSSQAAAATTNRPQAWVPIVIILSFSCFMV
ncbi:hypothetical protein ACN47E_004290 [Coniothyrium glycines]